MTHTGHDEALNQFLINMFPEGAPRGAEWSVKTSEEADDAVKDYIRESVWAFRADFIVDHTKLPRSAVEIIESFQEKCEGANEAILALIEDFDKFCEDAIQADGRGHFLSSYDGEENEEDINGTTYYIYREN